MKKHFDRYSKRGAIILVVSTAGLLFELLFKKAPDPFLIIMYGLVVLFGLALLIWIKDPAA